MMTRLANGAVALSVSLTGVVSLLTVVTAPPLVALWARVFLGEAAPAIDISALAFAMAAITAVPVLIGMVLRTVLKGSADVVEAICYRIAAVLFIAIVVIALAVNWGAFVENLPRLGPLLAAMVALLFGIGWLSGSLLSLDRPERAAISVEAGIQNGTLGITIAALITATGEALPPLSIPSAVYGILMYAVGLPIVFGLRRYVRGPS